MYFIVGKTINQRRQVVSYLITDGEGVREVTPQQVYVEYQNGNLSYLKGFNTNTGEVDFKNIDNSLIPTFYNGRGINNNVSVLKKLSINGVSGVRILLPNAAIENITDNQLIQYINSGKFQLFNAKIVNNKLVMKYDISNKKVEVNNDFIVENGVLVKYKGNADTLVVPVSVKEIGVEAFSGCSLKKVVIPGTVKVIGDSAFGYCSALECVELKEGVEKIDGTAFGECHNLKSVIMPDSVTGDLSYTFMNCDNLVDVKLSDNITIMDFTFSGCSKLASVVLPKNLKHMFSAFMECSSLVTVVFGDKLERIGRDTFSGCVNLEKLKLPEGIQYIGIQAFSKCTKLESIELPRNMKEHSVEYDAFAFWNENQKVYYYNKNIFAFSSADYEGKYTYMDHYGNTYLLPIRFDRILIKNGVSTEYIDGDFIIKGVNNKKLIKYRGSSAVVEVPFGIKEIGKEAFMDSNVKKVILSETVNIVGERAFCNCSSLEVVEANNVIDLYNAAFKNCMCLKTIPDSIKYIKNDVFKNCVGLTHVNFKEDVKIVGDCIFKDCKNLISVKLPEHLKVIRRGMFYGCSKLKDITLSENVVAIESYAFAECSSLSFINLSHIKFIERKAFSGCSKLDNITMTESLLIADDYAFENCINLKTVVLPNVDEEKFYVTHNIDESFYDFDLDEVYKYVSDDYFDYLSEGLFKGCTSLQTIDIPCNVYGFEKAVFDGCTNLKIVMILGDVEDDADDDEDYDSLNTESKLKSQCYSIRKSKKVKWSIFGIDTEKTVIRYNEN